MRGFGWKISLIAIIFCYPVGSLVARFVEYIGLKNMKDPTTTDQFQMLRIGNGFLVTIIVIGWLIAFIAGMESWGRRRRPRAVAQPFRLHPRPHRDGAVPAQLRARSTDSGTNVTALT